MLAFTFYLLLTNNHINERHHFFHPYLFHTTHNLKHLALWSFSVLILHTNITLQTWHSMKRSVHSFSINVPPNSPFKSSATEKIFLFFLPFLVIYINTLKLCFKTNIEKHWTPDKYLTIFLKTRNDLYNVKLQHYKFSIPPINTW